MLNAIAPLVIEISVLGYNPFANKHEWKSKIYSVFIIIFMVILASSTMDKLFVEFNKATIESSSQKSTIEFVQILANSIIILTSIPLIYFTITCSTDMSKFICEIDNVCFNLNYTDYYLQVRKYACIYTFIVIPIYYINSIKDAVVWSILGEGIFEISRYCLEGHVLIRSFHFLVEVQMIIFTLGVKFLLQLINEEIKELTNALCDEKSYLLKRLETLRISHATLCELLNNISNMFQPVLIFILTFVFIDILNGCFFGFISLLNLSGQIKNNYLVSIESFTWFLCFYSRLCHIILISEDTYNEVQATRGYVQKLQFKNKNENIKEELRLFNVQMLHTTPMSRLNALGIFYLDKTLLHSVNNTIATYLVVLLQFHNLYHQ